MGEFYLGGGFPYAPPSPSLHSQNSPSVACLFSRGDNKPGTVHEFTKPLFNPLRKYKV